MAVLDRCAELEPEELRRAIAAAAEILVEYGEGPRPVPYDVLDVAPFSAVHALAADLAPTGIDLSAVHRLLEDPKTAQGLAIYVTQRLAEHPMLLDMVEHRFADERRPTSEHGLDHSCVSLVALSLRVTRVQAGTHSCDISAQNADMKALIAKLVQEQALSAGPTPGGAAAAPSSGRHGAPQPPAAPPGGATSQPPSQDAFVPPASGYGRR
jgi:hypothetical protein